MAAQAAFTHYRTDSGYHAVYWIASWPRMQVEAAWLYPLLVLGGVRRTISVTAEPVAPSQSFREVRSAKVQQLTEEAQRQKLPLAEVWSDWATARKRDLRDEDGLELLREIRSTTSLPILINCNCNMLWLPAEHACWCLGPSF